MNAGGNANVNQNMPHDQLHGTWHFIFFGYTKTENKAYTFVKFRIG
jgi:hypothetical protein